MAVNCSQILKLYKSLLSEASRFPLYNFRMYALRRIRDKFHENKFLKDPAAIEEQYKEGLKSLELIKRQIIISQLYNPEKLIIEKLKEKK
ncbi:protein bcn92 [Homalodisca vitripennis]|uniref:protein bcn92 n=1 Tax=Homalodisca vitripennis TaxID=197043 RepID=UPI001EEA0971|nr:protein bcn92 [Homalodisca vitripennis]